MYIPVSDVKGQRMQNSRETRSMCEGIIHGLTEDLGFEASPLLEPPTSQPEAEQSCMGSRATFRLRRWCVSHTQKYRCMLIHRPGSSLARKGCKWWLQGASVACFLEWLLADIPRSLQPNPFSTLRNTSDNQLRSRRYLRSSRLSKVGAAFCCP